MADFAELYEMDDQADGEEKGSSQSTTASQHVKSAMSLVWSVFKRHILPLLLFVGFTVAGAALFQYLEADFEREAIKNVTAKREQLIADLWESARNGTNETAWKEDVLQQLHDYQAFRSSVLQPAFKLHGTEEDMLWSFWGGILYCGTIYTTIGYGLLCPKTIAGKACTIVYAILGIPLCMMVLNNFGKIMALSLRKLHWLLFLLYRYITSGARETGRLVGNVAGMAGDAAGRMVSTLQQKVGSSEPNKDETDQSSPSAQNSQFNTTHQEDSKLLEPSSEQNSPAKDKAKEEEAEKTEEDFNPSPLFPVLVQIGFILIGAWMYTQWEDWTYFESVYFICISLSTIGLGDINPAHPKFFVASCLYLFFGLALVSFFINTVLLQMQKVARRAKQAPGRIVNLGKKHLWKPPDGGQTSKSPSGEISISDSDKPKGKDNAEMV